MKVTGYKIREAISRNKLRRDTASSQFTDTLHIFPGETKRSPDEVMATIALAEDKIARLQVLQDNYNLQVTVDRPGPGTSLAFIVKTVGALERIEKMWRTAATKKKDRWASFTRDNPLLRDEKSVAAKETVSPEDCAKRAEVLQQKIGSYREVLGVANGTELEIRDLDTLLFE